MNIKFLTASVVAAYALSACQTAPTKVEKMEKKMDSVKMDMEKKMDSKKTSMEKKMNSAKKAVSQQRFECRNGMTVSIQRAGDSRIILGIDTDTQKTALTQARAASGELYVNDNGLYGKRTEWHQKAGKAVFEFNDKYGNLVETDCSKI